MMNYEDAGGDGTPVVALHGTFGRGLTFAAVATRLLPDYRVIGPDLRGHGLSDRGGDFSREAFVRDVADFIQERELAPALVIGHSLGGVTAYQLAARHPDLVRAVVVEDIGAVTDTTQVEQPVLDVTGWPRRFVRRADAIGFFAATPAPEYFLESVAGNGELLFDLDDMMAVQHGNAGSWWDDWQSVSCPVLLLRAANSFLLSTDLAAEMVRRRPGTELVAFAGAGHWIHREAPDDYAEVVRGFFARV
ncbi:alpha/beta hydrolase [Kribbella sp. NPDC051952]|uniref:alpha/beta fold hydrolase n=1 Tax=Kribbella sp. NPDC051952 TaxID=3154851 RepID=UPI00341C70A8